MTLPVGIHSATQLVRLGLPIEPAISILADELHISLEESAEAIRVAQFLEEQQVPHRA